MEEIYRPEEYAASIRFPLRSYFNEYKNLEFVNYSKDSAESEDTKLEVLRTRIDVNLDADEMKQLAKDCSIDMLKCPEENPIYPIDLPETIHCTTKLPEPYINTADELTSHVQKFHSEISREAINMFASKKTHNKPSDFETPVAVPDLSPGCDFLVTIRIYRPFTFKYFTQRNTSEKMRFSQEILALGSNTLDQLRDAIYCWQDFGICREVQSTSDEVLGSADIKEQYPSGFLFIDNTFYNDMRHPEAVDYSAPLLKWAKDRISGLKSANMKNVRIDSLTPRFGYPYLYTHQGDCEHLFVFSDARLLQFSDCLHSTCYPHNARICRRSTHSCLLCSVAIAKWICVDSDRFPQRVVYLCTNCCNSYNFLDGKKVGNFKLYPFMDTYVDYIE